MKDDTQDRKMIEAICVIDLDPTLSLFKAHQQKWVSSLQFMSEVPEEPIPHTKVLEIGKNAYLLIGFCEKNKPPIYQIDLLQQPSHEWVNVRLPQQFSSSGFFCYRCQEIPLSGPLADIDILVVQRKSMFGENQETATVPPYYHILNLPIGNNYLTYRKVRSKLQYAYKPALMERYPLQNKHTNLVSLPMFCFPDGIRLSKEMKGFITVNFIFTLETAQRIYCTCLIFKESLSQAHRTKLNIKVNEKIYYEKAICIVSKYCYTQQFSQCLQHLYRLSMSKNDLPFYQVIANFTDKLIMTKQIGHLGISYSYGGSNIMFRTNKVFPIVSEKAIYCIFKFLRIDIIINVFEAILLQRKIIFVSQSKTVLGYATQAFTSFIFPFKWQQVLIPILPYHLKEYLSAPVPLIAGVNFNLIDSSIESQTIIVFLDKNQIANEQTLPPLPEKMEKQLIKRLSQFQVYVEQQVKEYLENPQNTYIFKMQEIQNPYFKGNFIRDIFFEFLLSFMKNYKKYWVKKPNEPDSKDATMIGFSTEPQLLTQMFKVQQFLSDLNMSKVGSFGYKFTESSIFTAFIENKYLNPEDGVALFFDQCLLIKKSKKEAILVNIPDNDKYSVCEHPLIEKQGKQFYLYDHFPSILPPSLGIKEQEIKLNLDNQVHEEELLVQFIYDEYACNHQMYESNRQMYEPGFQNLENELFLKMMGLLIKKNKNEFPSKQTSHLAILKWFTGLYQRQNQDIDKFLQNWPKLQAPIKFVKIKKKDYLLNLGSKYEMGAIIGIHFNNDYEMMIWQENRLIITSARVSGLKRDNNFYIQIPCFRLKGHLNSIIQWQGLWLFEYLKENNRNYTHWNIEKLIEFHEWILSKKNK